MTDNIHKVMRPPEVTRDVPTGRLRWVENSIKEKTLQQEIAIEEFSGGHMVGITKVWRDVPVVPEGAAE